MYKTLTNDFIKNLVKNDISNVTKIDRLDKICNLQRIAFPVMQMVIWFVSQHNDKIEFCDVNNFSDEVKTYVDSAYDRNNEDSDAEQDSDQDVSIDTLRKKAIKKKQKKDAQETNILNAVLKRIKTIDKITPTTNVANFMEKNAAMIKQKLDAKKLDAEKLQTQIKAFFNRQKEKAIEQVTKEDLKKNPKKNLNHILN